MASQGAGRSKKTVRQEVEDMIELTSFYALDISKAVLAHITVLQANDIVQSVILELDPTLSVNYPVVYT